jgi:hypothetical protein
VICGQYQASGQSERQEDYCLRDTMSCIVAWLKLIDVSEGAISQKTVTFTLATVRTGNINQTTMLSVSKGILKLVMKPFKISCTPLFQYARRVAVETRTPAAYKSRRRTAHQLRFYFYVFCTTTPSKSRPTDLASQISAGKRNDVLRHIKLRVHVLRSTSY